ncbi:MAG: VWA domain-containing protein [Halobacteriales archaeon]|nr:VWA domain-containing protein [Halobacteriales archaeon]
MFDFDGSKKASPDRGASLSFSAIVGQEQLKKALLAVVANDELDGLLVQGEKGTAKSTAVRALRALLPTQTVIEGCPYGCPPNEPDGQCSDCRERTDPPTIERPVPLVTLPLGATREHVVGTLSVADALAGEYEFDPGLLAQANRGILYVDEVNLLDDHLVDVVLDAAASGVNRVERDGVSVSHPAQFTLVGTMNPEEGDLRPQLRDRFALQATVTACEQIDQRVTIIDRAIDQASGDPTDPSEDRETDPAVDPRERLRRARNRLVDIELPAEFAEEIAELCRDAGIDGHRGDIAAARAAMTFAALDNRSKVLESDVRRAMELALPHRLQSRPFEDTPDPNEVLDDHFDDDESEDNQGNDETGTDERQSEAETDRFDDPADAERPTSDPSASTIEGDGVDDDSSSSRADGVADNDGGRRTEKTDQTSPQDDDQSDATPIVPGGSRTEIGDGRAPDLTVSETVGADTSSDGTRTETHPHVDTDGARIRTERADSPRSIDAAASVRAATARGASSVTSRDLRRSVRQDDTDALVVFVVDASASMRPAMRAAKGTVLELLKDAYQQRDEVAFVAFAGEEADVLLPPTDSVSLASRHLKELPTGDRTPLPAGLRTASDVIDRADPTASVVVVVTDGRANVADGSPIAETRAAARRLAGSAGHVVVVDTDAGDDPRLTDLIATETDGDRVPLETLSADRIDAAVGATRENEV